MDDVPIEILLTSETYDANGSTGRSDDVRLLYFLTDCFARGELADSWEDETFALAREPALGQDPQPMLGLHDVHRQRANFYSAY